MPTTPVTDRPRPSPVVYVDYDPIVLAHGRALLVSSPEGRSVYIDADMREPEKILSHPVTRDTLDFTRPVALMLVSVLHFFTGDDQVRRIVGPLVDALPPGSYVTASHGTAEFAPEAREAGQAYKSACTGRSPPSRDARRPALRRAPPARELTAFLSGPSR